MIRSIFLICSTIAATGWCGADERTAIVSFLVVDEAGKTLDGWKVSSFKTGQTELAARFSGLTSKQIPTGFYEYVLSGISVRPDWTPTIGGHVEVLQAERFLVLTATRDLLSGLSIDRTLPASFVIRGKIEPMPLSGQNSEIVRINIHHMNPWRDINVRVDPSGDFRLFEPPTGLCLLTIFRGAEILHVEPVIFAQDFRKTSFVLRIPEKPRPVLRIE